MRLKTAAVAAFSAFSLLVVSVSADFSASAWPFYKTVDLPPGLAERGSLVEVVPDHEVFAEARAGLMDLRVVEAGSQQEVPYELVVEKGEHRRAALAATMRDLAHVPGEYTRFVVDLGREGIAHNEMEIRTASRNFQRRVVVEGSSDGDTWAVLEGEAQVFDLTVPARSLSVRDTRVRYPTSTARFLRVRIIDSGEPPLQIIGASAFFVQELPPREMALPLTVVSRDEDATEQASVLVLDMGSPGIPTSRLEIVTPQENFYRRVTLEGSADMTTWRRVTGSGAIYSYNTPRFVGGNDDLGYAEAAYQYFRLTIYNEDNPPLPDLSATAFGYLRRVIFSASPDRTYHLYYGNDAAQAPSYDLEQVFPYLVTENLPTATLGVQEPNPLFVVPPEPEKPFTERYPWLLPVVVAIGSLLVGVILASLLREIRKVLPPPPQAS